MKRILFTAAILGVISVNGCDQPAPATPAGPSALAEMQTVEENQKRLMGAIPPPKLQTSLERKNLVRRLERVNTENMVSYIYLLDHGKVVAYHTVSGKVSSLNSYLTAMEQIIEKGTRDYSGNGASWDKTYITIESPDHDGSYGKNSDGIFFFTTSGAYVEWSGTYFWSDKPMKLSQPPELVEIVGGDVESK